MSLLSLKQKIQENVAYYQKLMDENEFDYTKYHPIVTAYLENYKFLKLVELEQQTIRNRIKELKEEDKKVRATKNEIGSTFTYRNKYAISAHICSQITELDWVLGETK